MEEYDLLFSMKPETAPKRPAIPMTDEERAVVSLLEQGEVTVDSLIRDTGMPAGAMSSLLVGLEMKRAVRMLPGQLVAIASN